MEVLSHEGFPHLGQGGTFYDTLQMKLIGILSYIVGAY